MTFLRFFKAISGDKVEKWRIDIIVTRYPEFFNLIRSRLMTKKEYFPWCFGANFYPSTAINQLEMWQEETFDPVTIDRELGYGENIGMTIMRVYLHDLLWLQDRDGFLKRMEQFLAIAESHGIRIMFTFFDDCWNDRFALGKQPEPKPFTHNSGWVQSPGAAAADDLAQRSRLEEYVKGVLTHFAKDDRILLWDLYNEPGNGASGDHITKCLRVERSLPLLKDVFKWAREVKITQGITAGIWKWTAEFNNLNRFMLDHSDIVTFHSYMPPEENRECTLEIIKEACGRQVLCSEYMARTRGNTFKDCLPQFRELNVSAVNWGLVAGKTQTIFPWGWNKEKGMPEKFFHDIFNPDGTFLYPEEKEVFDKIR